jgi:hypothetical protein
MEGAVVVEVVSTTATGMLSFGLEEFSEEDDAAAVAIGNARRAALSSLLMALVASVGLCWNAFRNSIRVEDETPSEFGTRLGIVPGSRIKHHLRNFSFHESGGDFADF